jgi:serine/threonine-protein kinase
MPPASMEGNRMLFPEAGGPSPRNEPPRICPFQKGEPTMSAAITLTMTNGPLTGKCFVFREPTFCTIGRSSDCEVRVPDVPGYQDISRYHCLLDIVPPEIRVSDFGSLNGTFVNGVNIGKRNKRRPPGLFHLLDAPELRLKNGDQIRVGHLVFQVAVDHGVLGPDCGNDVPEDQGTEKEEAQTPAMACSAG